MVGLGVPVGEQTPSSCPRWFSGKSLGVFFRLHGPKHANEFNVVLQRFSKSLRPHTSARWNSSCVMRQFRFGGGGCFRGCVSFSGALPVYPVKERGSLRIKTWSPFSQKTSPKFFFLGICFVSVESYQTTSAWCTKSIFGCKKQNFNVKLVAPKP